MVEDPVVGLLECGSSRLVDGHLDITRVSLCEVVEAAISTLSVLVLRVFMLD